jgi:hypothetical protein
VLQLGRLTPRRRRYLMRATPGGSLPLIAELAS